MELDYWHTAGNDLAAAKFGIEDTCILLAKVSTDSG